jgi:hypothetical protein
VSNVSVGFRGTPYLVSIVSVFGFYVGAMLTYDDDAAETG